MFEVKKMDLQLLGNVKELLLQAYYSLVHYSMNDCVYCLTDGINYDYYKIAIRENKLEVVWFKQIVMQDEMGEVTSMAKVTDHIKFLLSISF